MVHPELDNLIHAVREAAARRTPLAIVGGGTKASRMPAPPGQTALDLRPLSGIVSYEPTELVVSVLGGTPLETVEATLAERGQYLPFEPPRFAPGGTAGGTVAAGLSGPARANVGAVRDYVLGVQMINGQGELLRFGGTVMKNVAGYDVSRLLAGSWGSLGILAEVSLKVLPTPPAEATLALELTQADALEQLHRWGAQPLPLNASVWRLDARGHGQLWLRLRGASAAVESACRSIGGERIAPDVAAGFWTSIRDQNHAWFAQRDAALALWRLSLPQTAPETPHVPGQAGPALIEWHGAQRWVLAPQQAGGALRDIARRLGGHATLSIAPEDQFVLANERFEPLSPPLDRIHRRIKEAFDPAGIFNPGPMAAPV